MIKLFNDRNLSIIEVPKYKFDSPNICIARRVNSYMSGNYKVMFGTFSTNPLNKYWYFNFLGES